MQWLVSIMQVILSGSKQDNESMDAIINQARKKVQGCICGLYLTQLGKVSFSLLTSFITFLLTNQSKICKKSKVVYS